MLALPDINRLKLKNSNKSKRGRNSAIELNNYKKVFKSINKTFFHNPNHISPINRQINNNSCKEKRNNHNNKIVPSILKFEKIKKIITKNLNQIKIINYSLKRNKAEKETIQDITEHSDKSKNIFDIRANRYYLKNIFFQRQIDIDQFIKEINPFLLKNNKIFEKIQNLINYKLMMNNNYSYALTQLLKNVEIPLNKLNYGLIFKCIIKNTFNESLKKAFLNKALISKKEIKEEYEKQINNLKEYLSIYNKEKEDFNNKKFDSLIISNNSSHLNDSKNSSIKNNFKKKIIKRNIRKRKIIQSNSCDNILFSSDNVNKNFFNSKYQNNNKGKKEINDGLKSSLDNTPDKENIENHIESIKSKKRFDFLREKRLIVKIKKQKNIVDDHIKSKEIIKNNENNLIKSESSFEEKMKKYEFLYNKHLKNDNEEFINSINNNDTNFQFENSLIKEQIKKYFSRRNKLKEIEFNLNSLNFFGRDISSIDNVNLENESIIKNLGLKNNNSYLKNSFSNKDLFINNIFIDKNSLNNNEKDNDQSNIKLIKENYSYLFNIRLKNRETEIKKYKKNKTTKSVSGENFFWKKNKNLNIKNFKGFSNREKNKLKFEKSNNKIEKIHNNK